jgi:hypothetical protein
MPVVTVEPSPPSTFGERLAGWWQHGNRLAVGGAGVIVSLLLAIALLGPGKPAGSDAGTLPSSTPTPAWLGLLMADYADACNATLDPADLAGMSQQEAEAQVAAFIGTCGTPQQSTGGGGKGGGSGKGHGHGHG